MDSLKFASAKLNLNASLQFFVITDYYSHFSYAIVDDNIMELLWVGVEDLESMKHTGFKI